MRTGAHGLGSEYLGVASDTVPLEITVLHARKRPEHMRHHVLCSALQADKQPAQLPWIPVINTEKIKAGYMLQLMLVKSCRAHLPLVPVMNTSREYAAADDCDKPPARV